MREHEIESMGRTMLSVYMSANIASPGDKKDKLNIDIDGGGRVIAEER